MHGNHSVRIEASLGSAVVTFNVVRLDKLRAAVQRAEIELGQGTDTDRR